MTKSVTKNDHFINLCHEGQLGPPSVTNGRVFISLSICAKNFLTRNIVVDVKQMINNSGMKSAKISYIPYCNFSMASIAFVEEIQILHLR